MNFIFRINEQIAEIISSNVRGALGLVINGLMLAVIIGILGFIVYWLVKLVLVSLVWAIPIIVAVLALVAVVYLLSKVSGFYK